MISPAPSVVGRLRRRARSPRRCRRRGSCRTTRPARPRRSRVRRAAAARSTLEAGGLRRAARSRRIASWLGSSRRHALCSSTAPGAVNAAMLSTWPSVSRSSTRPWPSQTIRSAPSCVAQRRPRSRPRRAAGCGWGSAGTARWSPACPSPSTAIEPPSSTNGASSRSIPRCRRAAPPTAASLSYGANFSPHALKPKCDRRAPASLSSAKTKIGPVSRSHESSIGSSTTSTAAASARARVGRVRAGSRDHRHRLERGDRVGDRRRIRARAALELDRPTASSRHGQAISVRSCGAHSAGIRRPAALMASAGRA